MDASTCTNMGGENIPSADLPTQSTDCTSTFCNDFPRMEAILRYMWAGYRDAGSCCEDRDGSGPPGSYVAPGGQEYAPNCNNCGVAGNRCASPNDAGPCGYKDRDNIHITPGLALKFWAPYTSSQRLSRRALARAGPF